MEIIIHNQTFVLDHRKVVFDVTKKRLILADLHVGKSAHFRKNGHSMPSYGFENDLKRLQDIMQDYSPKEVLILGDLFHSDHNEEFDKWNKLVASYSETDFQLVIGNHDRWTLTKNRNQRMKFVNELNEDFIKYTHEPTATLNQVNFCGHLHPGVNLIGTGRQRLKLSCFWLSEKTLLFPAFSELTGLCIIKPKKEDRVFAAVGDKVVEIT